MSAFTTEYRYPDYLHANRLYLLRQWLTLRSALFLLALFVTVSALNVGAYAGSLLSRIGASALHALAYFVGAGVLLVIGFFYSLPRTARTHWQKNDLAGNAASYRVQSDGFTVASPSVDLSLNWKDFRWWTEDDRLLLAKPEARCTMIWLPKDQVGNDILDSFREGFGRCQVKRI